MVVGARKKGREGRKGRHAGQGTASEAEQRLRGACYPAFPEPEGLLGADNTISCRSLVRER